MSEIGLQISRKRSKSPFKISDSISICESLHEGTNDKKDPKKDTLSSTNNFNLEVFATGRVFPSHQLAKELIATQRVFDVRLDVLPCQVLETDCRMRSRAESSCKNVPRTA